MGERDKQRAASRCRRRRRRSEDLKKNKKKPSAVLLKNIPQHHEVHIFGSKLKKKKNLWRVERKILTCFENTKSSRTSTPAAWKHCIYFQAAFHAFIWESTVGRWQEMRGEMETETETGKEIQERSPAGLKPGGSAGQDGRHRHRQVHCWTVSVHLEQTLHV